MNGWVCAVTILIRLLGLAGLLLLLAQSEWPQIAQFLPAGHLALLGILFVAILVVVEILEAIKALFKNDRDRWF
jgi:hypothetical protein